MRRYMTVELLKTVLYGHDPNKITFSNEKISHVLLHKGMSMECDSIISFGCYAHCYEHFAMSNIYSSSLSMTWIKKWFPKLQNHTTYMKKLVKVQNYIYIHQVETTLSKTWLMASKLRETSRNAMLI